MEKTINLEEKRELEAFEKKYIDQLLSARENKTVKIYNSIGSNWNLIFLNESQFFVSIPKTELSCSPSIYGSLKHAEQYNIFIDIIKD